MNQPKPHLLMDVDGVLNAFDAPELEKQFVTANLFDIQIPVGTTSRIERLEEAFDLVWCTTWEYDAPAMLSPHLGFGANWPVIPLYRGYIAENRTWKLRSVRDWAKDKGPLAWADDDLHDDAHRWALGRNERVPTFLVQVDLSTGLTWEDTQVLLGFADQVRERGRRR